MLKIYDSNITVRNDEISYNIYVDYSTLNSKGQRRLFLENKNLFIYEAIYSKYESIRKLARKHLSECSSQSLEKILINEWYRKESCDENLVLTILGIENLKLGSAIRECLALDCVWKVRLWFASNLKTPAKLLTKMFLNEVDEFLAYEYTNIIDAIILNPKFKITKSLDEKLQSQYGEKDYLKIIKRIKDVQETK